MSDKDKVIQFPQSAGEAFTPRPMSPPGELVTLCRQYLNFLSARGRAANTVNAYRIDLEQFTGFLMGQGTHHIQTVSTADIDNFVTALIREQGRTARTAARKLETVRGLFKYAHGRGLLKRNPCEDATSPKVTPRTVIAPEAGALVKAIDAIPDDDPQGLCERAVFRLLLDAGLRASALCRLDVYDPDRPPPNTITPEGVVVFTNKGGAVRSTPIDAKTQDYVARWLEVRRARPREQALFTNRNGKRLTRHALHARCKKWGARIGLPDLHLHMLRHSRARTIIEGLGLRECQQFLHHQSVETTAAVYGHYGEVQRHRMIRERCALDRLDAPAKE